MLTKDDLFTSVSKTAVNLKQDSVPKEKRPYNRTSLKKRMVTQAERYQIGKLLEENLTPKDTNGIVSYLHDMDDHKIAALIGPHVSYDTVRNMRQEVFGILRRFVPPIKNRGQNYDDMLVRIERLEKLFDQLAEEIGSAFRTWTDRL